MGKITPESGAVNLFPLIDVSRDSLSGEAKLVRPEDVGKLRQTATVSVDREVAEWAVKLGGTISRIRISFSV